MKTQKVKTPRRSGALYSSGSKQTKASTSFLDNRSETITQRKLSEMAGQSFNHSDSVQLKQVLNSKAIPVQKIQDEEEELLQGKFATAQRQKAEEEELLQGKFSNIQRKENNTGLPDNLKSGVENLSGMSMDDVKVHRNSGEPAKVQAHAFAQGTNIHLAPGQEKHLPHEAWHVVQQKQGRVKPTMQLKGKVNVNDDAGLEREADVMGGKAFVENVNVLAVNKSQADMEITQRKTNARKIKSRGVEIIQKLQTEESIRETLGKPKGSLRIGHGSKKYKDVLNAVAEYHKYIRETKFIKNSYIGQYGEARLKLEKIETHIKAYDRKKDKAKPKYFYETLMPSIEKEKAILAETVLMINSGKSKSYSPMVPPSLGTFMLDASANSAPVSLGESQVSGSDRGGSSELTKFNLPGNTVGYFKENKEKLTHFNSDQESDNAMSRLREEMSEEDAGLAHNAMTNESNLGVGLLKIDPEDAHMAKRDIAMDRLDRLLGANVIARTRIANRNLPGNKSVKGSLMDQAQGNQAASLMKQKLLTKDATEKSTKAANAVNQEDQTLMSLLSKLQLLDLIALQIDRNPKNYFIQSDNVGKVTGITGIDNDYAFGNETNNSKRQQELPGMSKYVDKTVALTILRLDTALIPTVFADLLTKSEIDALVARFKNVQNHLADIGIDNFLDLNQWDASVAKGLKEEDKSYWADLEFFKGKYGK